jgi:beta-xylosidase
VVFQNEHSFFFLGVTMRSASSPEIFAEQGTGTALASTVTILAREQLPPGGNRIQLRITETGPNISFSYRLPGRQWTRFAKDADATLLSTLKAGGFVGSFIGTFARLKNSEPTATPHRIEVCPPANGPRNPKSLCKESQSRIPQTINRLDNENSPKRRTPGEG